MLGFIKKLFGSKPETTPVPYKVEAPKVEQFPTKVEKKPTAKKPVTKAKTVRKPRTPKAS